MFLTDEDRVVIDRLKSLTGLQKIAQVVRIALRESLANREGGQCQVHDVTPENTPGDVPEVLHDDSRLWDAVYAAAWVSDFRAARAALEKDHAKAARRIADAAVAQLRRR
jgi:hypothetical protein